LPATPSDLMATLARLGIAVKTVSHTPVFTVAESRSLRGEIPGAHTKNLFLVDKKGALFLVTAEEDAAIDLKHLHHRLGASGRFSFGKPALLMAVLGVPPGAVTPFAAINDTEARVTVVLDRALAMSEVVNAHPLVNSATTTIAAADLIAFLRATGHEPLIVPLSEALAIDPEPSGQPGEL
jgi:Ala-tRNA(Pro) deacylase